MKAIGGMGTSRYEQKGRLARLLLLFVSQTAGRERSALTWSLPMPLPRPCEAIDREGTLTLHHLEV